MTLGENHQPFDAAVEPRASVAEAPACGYDRRVRRPGAAANEPLRPHLRSDEFWREVKRRNVWRVAILYALVSWFILEPAGTLLAHFGEVALIRRDLVPALAMLFPVLLLAWFFEITPDGIRRTDRVDRRHSLAGKTGRYLDRAIFAVVALTLAYIVVDKFWLTAYTSNLS
jgi:hypothetical protein